MCYTAPDGDPLPERAGAMRLADTVRPCQNVVVTPGEEPMAA